MLYLTCTSLSQENPKHWILGLVLVLFLCLLEVLGPERVIGRTRDDRAPFVRQMQMTEWFEVAQPNVSR
jgi:hypothetical protein